MSNYSAELFVRLWQGAETLDEVCEQLGLTKNNASKRAYMYRKLGIPLKRLYAPKRPNQVGRPRLDAARLARIARGEE